MFQVLTTNGFADWFAGLDDRVAEEVATAVELVEQLGATQAPPGSRESLLWYEDRRMARFGFADALSWDLEAWGALRDYAQQILAKLESPQFSARLERLRGREAGAVLDCIRQIRRAMDPRLRWALKLSGSALALGSDVRPENACTDLRRLYFAALEAAGFKVEDVPAHSLALRELARREPAPAFRVLYGVHVQRETALFVLGEWLDRSYYGDSVRRAERMWKQFLQGELGTAEPLRLR
jgi:hypothetical protein